MHVSTAPKHPPQHQSMSVGAQSSLRCDRARHTRHAAFGQHAEPPLAATFTARVLQVAELKELGSKAEPSKTALELAEGMWLPTPATPVPGSAAAYLLQLPAPPRVVNGRIQLGDVDTETLRQDSDRRITSRQRKRAAARVSKQRRALEASAWAALRHWQAAEAAAAAKAAVTDVEAMTAMTEEVVAEAQAVTAMQLVPLPELSAVRVSAAEENAPLLSSSEVTPVMDALFEHGSAMARSAQPTEQSSASGSALSASSTWDSTPARSESFVESKPKRPAMRAVPRRIRRDPAVVVNSDNNEF